MGEVFVVISVGFAAWYLGGGVYLQRVLFSCLPRPSCWTFGFKVFQNNTAFTMASLMEGVRR